MYKYYLLKVDATYMKNKSINALKKFSEIFDPCLKIFAKIGAEMKMQHNEEHYCYLFKSPSQWDTEFNREYATFKKNLESISFFFPELEEYTEEKYLGS
jgi:hypothetical protein